MHRSIDSQAVRPFTDALERLDINFYIGGSVATSVHGVQRATEDTDVIASIHPDHVDRLVKQLERDYYVDAQMISEAIRHRRAFNIIHYDTSRKIDVFLPKQRPFDRMALERSERHLVFEGDDERYPVASPEDSILAKLEWYRQMDETSQRQWSDVIQTIEIKRPMLDVDYLRLWASELNVDDLLERALAEAQ